MKIDVDKALRRALNTGKVYLGSKRTIKALKKGDAKLVIMANNCPEEIAEKLKQFEIPVITYNGTNIDLGATCGKPFSVSMLAIIEPGESEILNII
ncbi:LSU ribosomal protein L30E [Archaeoglobus sulfaticallidus PM70-1]|uniref:Large ribosomal subunit protein eL30 n=1 Tax=Archaeoglobus sulfaticallidus PM70-1 TaxID=387631 RepID=N0BCI8_9EURY|nr:50S ribosomal protein L30e [Archaeoglobus sulfaticallidus]AGK60718.1 LSU ribosomal protein L30E [Archaeoglobus sulfaticallidus PM70-1]